MIFAPHILQVKVITPMAKDEFGRPIPGTGGEYWQEVCKCRCDDVSAEKKVWLSGNIWLVSFKISYLCLPLFYETRTTPSCHPSGCAYRQL